MPILPAGTVPEDACRTSEAEVFDIRAMAVTPQERMRMGDALAAFGLGIGLADEDVAALESMRDKAPAQPLNFDD